MKDNCPVFPDGEAVITATQTLGITLLIIDPWNHTHGLADGNSNALIAQVAAEVSSTGYIHRWVIEARRDSRSNTPEIATDRRPDDLHQSPGLYPYQVRANFAVCL
jgi:hypothetical protein